MQSLLLNVFDDWAVELGVGVGLIIALLVIGIAIVVASIVCGILRLIIAWNYWIARKPVASGMTGEQAAREILQRMGVTDVEVKKEGFFRALFYNNHYNPKKKTVYLRRTTFKGKNVTSIALAVQKAALVRQDKENSGRFRARWRLQQCAIFGPLFFLPLVVVGLVIDFVMSLNGTDFSGVATLSMTAVALVLFVISMLLAGLTIPVEKRATREAIEMLQQTEFLSPDELEKAERVLKTYIIAYITDFIIAILKLIQFILKLILQIFALFANKDN